ncbi:HD-GYP domain-containing protein [Desulfofalx alkaliphila]|uniref:HD-GYP domain-containing protein n=1 Tax=Desulfofalx alkaliphila TaxID=105483 RepID=UPI0004E0E4E6|nr:HD-GYP domain-containing protein [Desulfofalx alkaliphila]
MRKIGIEFLKEGMKVARPVYNNNGQVLLNAGVLLNKKYISKLKELNIPALYIDDGLLPELEVDDIIAEETRVKAITTVKNIMNKASNCKMSKNIIIPEAVLDSINDILDDLLNNKNIMVNLTDIRSNDDYVFGHSVNVCVLALITGIAMGFPRKKLIDLAVGAILHDIGKMWVPKEILNKPGKLTREEFEVVKKHSEWGYEILRNKANVSIISCAAVYQHHERYNGQGYPQGLVGDQIHELAQIIGLVDMYDAVASNRVYRKAFPAHEAFELIAASGDYLFRYDIVEAFLDHVAAYPAGTLVLLNTGEHAVVVETPVGMSLRPKVKLLYDAEGNPITEKVYINLSEVVNITIKRLLEDDEIAALKRATS